jgi:lysozyme
MKTSLKGILALLDEEAVVLTTYKDSKGVLTIGVGHTPAAGGVAPKPGNRMTIEQAISLFAADLAKFERRVEKSVGILAEHQNDALVSFDFNTGAIDGGSIDEKKVRRRGPSWPYQAPGPRARHVRTWRISRGDPHQGL